MHSRHPAGPRHAAIHEVVQFFLLLSRALCFLCVIHILIGQVLNRRLLKGQLKVTLCGDSLAYAVGVKTNGSTGIIGIGDKARKGALEIIDGLFENRCLFGCEIRFVFQGGIRAERLIEIIETPQLVHRSFVLRFEFTDAFR